MTDAERLDWLQSLMQPAENYVEVYLAGLRNGIPDWSASTYQVELKGEFDVRKGQLTAINGKTLRDAIDSAMLLHPRNPA